MDITQRALITVLHGMGFGALFLLGTAAILLELVRVLFFDGQDIRFDRVLKWLLFSMTIAAWLCVLSGTYIVYPWYRAAAPASVSNLAAYPQLLLKSNAATAGWHSLGMEWKEHIAWLVPIAMTMVTSVFFQYGREIRFHRHLRSAVLFFAFAAFFAAGVAAFFGAMINKYAPINGGAVIHVLGSGTTQ